MARESSSPPSPSAWRRSWRSSWDMGVNRIPPLRKWSRSAASRSLESLRSGEIDVLVGVNLLREGLDLPEVSLVAIFDADKEGFLSATTSPSRRPAGRAVRTGRARHLLCGQNDPLDADDDRRDQPADVPNSLPHEAHGIVPKQITRKAFASTRAHRCLQAPR